MGTNQQKGIEMWTFDVVATEQRRLFPRVLQVIENHVTHIHSFTGKVGESEIHIRFVVSMDGDKAYRIQSLLYRLTDVREVSVCCSAEIDALVSG